MTRVGTVLSLPGAALAELAGTALDLAWIDLEHGALGIADVQEMTVGLTAAGCEAHVRLPACSTERLAAIVDAGVDGVVLPRVECADTAREVVSALRYPPGGRRGFGPRRAGRYGRTGEFWTASESRVTCTVQIETLAGVGNASHIADVDGVDALVVGCSDLSLELAAPQDLSEASVRGAVAEVARAAAAAGARFGLAASGDPAAIASLAPAALDLVIYSADVRLYSAAVDEAVRSLDGVHA
jgi:4-hydroxy-2-oxoheptanedioate aldolase